MSISGLAEIAPGQWIDPNVVVRASVSTKAIGEKGARQLSVTLLSEGGATLGEVTENLLGGDFGEACGDNEFCEKVIKVLKFRTSGGIQRVIQERIDLLFRIEVERIPESIEYWLPLSSEWSAKTKGSVRTARWLFEALVGKVMEEGGNANQILQLLQLYVAADSAVPVTELEDFADSPPPNYFSTFHDAQTILKQRILRGVFAIN